MSDADVIVVGAGPGGSTAAFHLARHGLNVLVLEKTEFPREKVCGDGLTPRAVKQLVKMGIDTSEKSGWLHNKGLRVIGGGIRMELDWPDLATYPPQWRRSIAGTEARRLTQNGAPVAVAERAAILDAGSGPTR